MTNFRICGEKGARIFLGAIRRLRSAAKIRTPIATSISNANDFATGALVETTIGSRKWRQCPSLTRKTEIVNRHQRTLVKAFSRRVDHIDRAENGGKVDMFIYNDRRSR